MQREFTFRIKEEGFRKWHRVVAVIDVPENWDDISEDDQREYLIRPQGNRMHPCFVYQNSSLFEKHALNGIENGVVDFHFRSRLITKRVACGKKKKGASQWQKRRQKTK